MRVCTAKHASNVDCTGHCCEVPCFNDQGAATSQTAVESIVPQIISVTYTCYCCTSPSIIIASFCFCSPSSWVFTVCVASMECEMDITKDALQRGATLLRHCQCCQAPMCQVGPEVRQQVLAMTTIFSSGPVAYSMTSNIL